MHDVFAGDAAAVHVNKQAHHAVTVRNNHDWLLRTDTERLMRLLGQRRLNRDHPATSWLLPPPTPADWRAGRRRARLDLASVKHATGDHDVTTCSGSLLPTRVNEPDHKQY